MQPGMDGKVSQLSWPAVFHSAFRDDGGMTSVHAHHAKKSNPRLPGLAYQQVCPPLSPLPLQHHDVESEDRTSLCRRRLLPPRSSPQVFSCPWCLRNYTDLRGSENGCR